MSSTRPAIPSELAASVQHLGLLDVPIKSAEARLARLRSARTQTLEQIAVAAKRVGAERSWNLLDYLALYEEINCPGLFAAWNAVGLPHPSKMRAESDTTQRCAPNDPASGGWVGGWDWGTPGGPLLDAYPRDWTPVVYVLYGANAEPIYCGSTEHFRQRLKAHHREGKEFVAYRAVRCADRERAFALEDRLLKQSCPPLNRRASR